MNKDDILNLIQEQNDKIEELSDQLSESNMALQDALNNLDNKQSDIDQAYMKASQLIDTIKQLKENIEFKYSTDVDIDTHPNMSKIITIGRYKGQDYVQVHTVQPDDFNHLVHIVRNMTKAGVVNRIDAPIQLRQPFQDLMEYSQS